MKILRWMLLPGALSCFVALVSAGSAYAVTVPLDEINLLQGLPPVTEGAVIICEGDVDILAETCALKKFSDVVVFGTKGDISTLATYDLGSANHVKINSLTTPSLAVLISEQAPVADANADLIPSSVTTSTKLLSDLISSTGVDLNFLFLTEPVNEGNGEVITYTPTSPLQPGFDASGTVTSYSITSDAAAVQVPEPASALLLGTGVLGLSAMRTRPFPRGRRRLPSPN